jgi:hypothetical protein
MLQMAKIRYTVHVIMDHDTVSPWRKWMLEEHIPEVLATGAFESCVLLGGVDLENQFAIEYVCKDEQTFRDYEKDFAPALRDKTKAKFGDHCRYQRMLHYEIRTW